MIYIIEGQQGAGKTTLCKTRFKDYEYIHKIFTIENAKQFLTDNKNRNLVFDRMFILSMKNNTDKEIKGFNKWLLKQNYIKCYKCLTSVNNSLLKAKQRCLNEENVLRMVNENKALYDRVFSLMTCFETIQDLSNIDIIV